VAQLPSFYAEDTPASANELWSRLHSDPLFAARPAARAALTRPTRRPGCPGPLMCPYRVSLGLQTLGLLLAMTARATESHTSA